MPSQPFENGERKAAQARHAASILLGTSAKVTMLEMADHYWKLASAARQDITKPVQSNDYLITHKPQPISGADMAWVWFGRRPM
jgi:hypothetical protein